MQKLTVTDVARMIESDLDNRRMDGGEVLGVTTYEDAGILHSLVEDGVVVTFEDGSEFQITVVRNPR